MLYSVVPSKLYSIVNAIEKKIFCAKEKKKKKKTKKKERDRKSEIFYIQMKTSDLSYRQGGSTLTTVRESPGFLTGFEVKPIDTWTL